jgi:hypothetical protein
MSTVATVQARMANDQNDVDQTSIQVAAVIHDTFMDTDMALGESSTSTSAVATAATTTSSTAETTTLIQTGRYKSKCHPRYIPDIAKDVSWDDPFYENETDAIAAFDVYWRQLPLCKHLFFRFVILVVTAVVMFVVFKCMFFRKDDKFSFVFLVILVGTQGNSIYQEILEKYVLQHKLRHIACALSGIYIDESENPHDYSPIRRTMIEYKDIEKCYETVWAIDR